MNIWRRVVGEILNIVSISGLIASVLDIFHKMEAPSKTEYKLYFQAIY